MIEEDNETMGDDSDLIEIEADENVAIAFSK
jgi:hypothetical protein